MKSTYTIVTDNLDWDVIKETSEGFRVLKTFNYTLEDAITNAINENFSLAWEEKDIQEYYNTGYKALMVLDYEELVNLKENHPEMFL